jgi:hypothetical protein
MCYILVIVLSISRYLLGSLKYLLKSSALVPTCWNNKIYANTIISFLLIKAAAYIIVSGRYISNSSSSLTAFSLFSSSYFIIRYISSYLALALPILVSSKILL